MIGDGVLHAVHDELDALLDVGEIGRQRGLAQLHARAGFVDQIDGLVRQVAVRNVAAGSEHRGLDGFIGVPHGVELLVAILDAEQDLDGVRFVGRRHLDGLEAPFQRAIFLDGLAELGRRGGADALNFAARERRLQNVGRVERAFGRTRAHQGMQLVDEDDGVLILHQLFHDGLEPLFELAAILGAGHDQREVQRQDALVGEERRHVAFGDALRQALDDGRLAHAGLADQHRVVLGAAAEDLDDALQFVVASDERVERVVHGGLGEVAAELGQQRTFLGPGGRHLFTLRTRQFFADGGQPEAPLVQDLRREALFLAQQTEQQVLRADVLVAQALGFLRTVGQDAFAFVAEGQIHAGGNLLADGGVSFNLLSNGFYGSMGPQKTVRQRFVLAQQAEQQMFRLNVGTSELAGFIPREEDHSTRLLRITLKHKKWPPITLKDTPGRLQDANWVVLPVPGHPFPGSVLGRSGVRTPDCA